MRLMLKALAMLLPLYSASAEEIGRVDTASVSYTHLTLPTNGTV